MVLWIITAVVGWANFQFGRWVAMWFRPRVPGARSSPVSSIRMAAALIIAVVASSFLIWNQTAKAYPFTKWHAAALGACLIFGYQSIKTRQSSLHDDINSLSRGVSGAFTQPLSGPDRMKALVAVAMQNELLASKLSVGVFDSPDKVPRTAVKIVDNELVDNLEFPNVVRTSVEEKIDILLQEIGFSILAKFGEDVMPQRIVEGGLSARDWRHIKESSERTRAMLDSSAIDWAHVNDAVFHISEARVRRGIQPAELTAMEKRVKEQRSKP
jgi:hypothetical protein